jgi:predicted lysophospholipase L1 biosynthesis ABC-type transport system permease subunit
MADQSPAPVADRDWTVEVTDRIESVIDVVRDKTTVPATRVAEMVVFGVVAGLLAVVAFFSLILLVIRLLYVYLPIHPISRRIWIADAIAAAIFLGSGLFVWRMRQPKGS